MIEWYDLNSRQQAAVFWTLVALLLVLLKSTDVRDSVGGLLRSFFRPTIFLSTSGLLVVTAVVSVSAVYLGRSLGAFETPPVVTSIVWACTAGITLMVTKIGRSNGEMFAVRALTKTVAPATLLSILLNFSVMGIWWEISTFPFITALGILAVFASLKEKYAQVARALNRVFVIWTLAMLVRAVYSLIHKPGAWTSLVESVTYPLLLTVGTLPYIYSIAQHDRLRFILGCVSRKITAEEYGDRWPLTVERAKLCCRHSAVWVKVNRKRYGVNGMSYGLLERYGFRVHQLEEIWRPNPAIEGSRVSIGPLIEDGLKLENRE